MKTIYYDALFTGLIPVKDCKQIENNKVQGTVSKTVKAYKKGDIVSDFGMQFVNKVRINSSGFIMVKTANIAS